MVIETIKMDLKGLLNVKQNGWNEYIDIVIRNRENVLQITRHIEEKGKMNVKYEYFVSTEIPIKDVSYYDYNSITDTSLHLNKKDEVRFFIGYTESENLKTMVELFSRLKNAKLKIEYHRYNTSQNDIDKGFQSELLRFYIITKSKTHVINLKNHCIYDSCLMIRTD